MSDNVLPGLDRYAIMESPEMQYLPCPFMNSSLPESSRFPSELQRNSSFCTADLHDYYVVQPDAHLQVVAPGLFSFGGRRCYHGKIVTLAAAEKAPLVIKDILSEPGQGRVLVIEGQGANAPWAFLGERMALLGLKHEWAGVIVHGYVRDVGKLRELPFGVHALGSIPSRPALRVTGAVKRDVELDFLRARFLPGHWLYADEDGLLIAGQELKIPTNQGTPYT